MKVLIVIFVFGGDELLLKPCVDIIRARCGDVDIILVDDASCPCQPHLVDEAGVDYVQTRFNRAGNLRGMECVRGELATFANMGKVYGAEWVVKLDVDTVLCGLDFLAEYADAEYVGFEGLHAGQPTGICYALRPELADRLLDRAAAWLYGDQAVCPEDQVIGLLARLECGDAAVVLPFGSGEYVRAAGVEHLAHMESLCARVAVHFGQSELLGLYPAGLRAVQVSRWLREWMRVN